MDDAMTWVIIAVALIIVAGPVFWLLPSPRERRKALLRTEARRAGLVVELASLDKPDATPAERVSAGGVRRQPKVWCAAYRLALPAPPEDGRSWLLRKTSADTGDRVVPGWLRSGRPESLPNDAGYWRRVAAVANALPGGCVGLEMHARWVSWYGHEALGDASAEQVVAGIRAGLETLAGLHALDDERSGPNAPE